MNKNNNEDFENSLLDFDIIIVGGGLIGASMACALANQPLRIAIIEAFPFRSNNQPSYDARSIALSYGSQRIFETLGLWPSLGAEASAIKQIHISNKGQCGVTRINAADENLDALGLVIENRNIGNSLLEKIHQSENITLICPAKLTALSIKTDFAELEILQNDEQRKLRCKLIVAADGGNSKVRQLLDIDSQTKDYKQTAIVSNVTPGKPHNGVAYERFTDQGPIAVLPMTENRCSLVLTVNQENTAAVLAKNDESFLDYLETRFGFRTGGFIKTSTRSSYPLSLMTINQHYQHRVVIIGNAAHTLHPIAGQGFNLGLRDVSVLVEVIADAIHERQDFGSESILCEYQKQRNPDQKKVAFITDTLASIFSNEFYPLAKTRSKALLFTDILPPLKHQLAKEAMGVSGRLPKLSRGVPL